MKLCAKYGPGAGSNPTAEERLMGPLGSLFTRALARSSSVDKATLQTAEEINRMVIEHEAAYAITMRIQQGRLDGRIGSPENHHRAHIPEDDKPRKQSDVIHIQSGSSSEESGSDDTGGVVNQQSFAKGATWSRTSQRTMEELE